MQKRVNLKPKIKRKTLMGQESNHWEARINENRREVQRRDI